MQTRLSLADERESFMTRSCIRDELRFDSRLAHLGLLRSFPAVRMREDKFYVVLDALPESRGMTVLDICAGALHKICKKVGQDIDNCLFEGKSGQLIA